MADRIGSRAECRSFSRYLAGIDPTDRIARAYARGISSAGFQDGLIRSALDPVLDWFAGAGWPGLALADTYARFLAPAGPLRRRMVLLCAILESAPVSSDAFEPPPAGVLRSWTQLVVAGLGFALRLPIALLLIGPLHVAARITSRRPSDRVQADTSP